MTWWLRALLASVAAYAAYWHFCTAWFYFRRRRALGERRRGLRLVITTRRSHTTTVSKG